MIIGRALGTVCLFAALTGITIAQGAESLFNEKCSTCHGTDGSGKTAAGKKLSVPDLRTDKQVAEMTDKEIFESIGRGTRHKNYPHSFLYTGLTEAQVHSLVTHVRKFQKK